MIIERQHSGLPTIRTRRLVLRALGTEHITPEYEHWLNDPAVNQFLEIRFERQTRAKMEIFLREKAQHIDTSKHFGVFDEDGQRLVGTVSSPTVNLHHLSADVSFVIGHSEASGKHYATEAVHALVYYLIYECQIQHLHAGYYEGHVASARVLTSNGFRIEGQMRSHYVSDGMRLNRVLVGLLASEFTPNEKWLGPLSPLASGIRGKT